MTKTWDNRYSLDPQLEKTPARSKLLNFDFPPASQYENNPYCTARLTIIRFHPLPRCSQTGKNLPHSGNVKGSLNMRIKHFLSSPPARRERAIVGFRSSIGKKRPKRQNERSSVFLWIHSRYKTSHTARSYDHRLAISSYSEKNPSLNAIHRIPLSPLLKNKSPAWRECAIIDFPGLPNRKKPPALSELANPDISTVPQSEKRKKNNYCTTRTCHHPLPPTTSPLELPKQKKPPS